MKTAVELQNLIVSLARKHGFDLGRPKSWLHLEMDGFNPLVIGMLPDGKNLLSVAQELEWDGETLQDPGVVLFTGGKQWEPASIDIPAGGLHIYALPDDDFARLVPANATFAPIGDLPKDQAGLARFCDEWARDLREQGWLEKAKRRAE